MAFLPTAHTLPFLSLAVEPCTSFLWHLAITQATSRFDACCPLQRPVVSLYQSPLQEPLLDLKQPKKKKKSSKPLRFETWFISTIPKAPCPRGDAPLPAPQQLAHISSRKTAVGTAMATHPLRAGQSHLGWSQPLLML